MTLKKFFLVGVKWVGNYARSLFNLGNEMPKKTKKTKVEKVMHEFKAGKLKSGSKKGSKVTSRKQAVAIALSEAGLSKKSKKKKK